MGVRNIAVTITGDGSSLSRALLRSGSEVDGFSKKVETSNGRMALSWKTAGLAAAAGVTAVAVGLTAAGVAAAQFETRMRNVNSLVHLNDQQFAAMSKSVLELSTRLPQSANTLAEGLYDITSSGFAGADALQILDKSAQAASAGLTTTANAAQAIDAVLNAYGLSAASAGDVSDTLFQTVNLGVISFEQLTGVIGDVVGTAAAAKVPISEVGSAIATMTLSGLSAAESGTSLNRVLQSLIQPSDALKTVYQQLGIESGAQELATKGLAGTMKELQKATGGNVTTLLQLFPDIRAVRGALALMSNEGKTYARVSAAIDNENARQGATHRALAEQMKATSAQLHLVENQARAAAITVGTHVLPVFLAFLTGMQTLGHEAAPLLAAGISAVLPMLESLYRTGQNVVTILGELFHAVEPIAAGLLKVGGAAIVGGLTAVAAALQAVTGFLAKHEGVVRAVGALYLATLLPSVSALVVAFNRLILTPVVLGLNAMIGAAGGGATALRTLTASMLSFQTVATLGVAVALYALTSGFSNLHKSQAEAKQDISDLTANFNTLKTESAQATIDALNAKVQESIETGNRFQGVWGRVKLGLNQLPGGNHTFATIAYEGQQAQAALEALNEQVLNTNGNLVKLAADTGYSVDAIRHLAAANNIDLSAQMFTEAGIAARKQVLDLLKDIAKQSGTTGEALQSAAGMDLDAMEALAKAIGDVRDKVASAFSRDTDVFAGFDPKGAADAQKQATEQVAQAEQDLADARARASANGKISVSDSIAIRKAQEGLATAQANAARTAQEQPTSIATAYRQTLALANSFSRDIQRAQAAGLDPAAVTRLLELGPKQAEPILQQLVSDHSGRLIKMVNDSEAALAKINTRVVEQARLTALATNSTTDTLSKNLTAALRVSAEAQTEGGKATVQSVAKALGLPDARVRQLAQAFGITLRDNIQKGLTAQPLKPPHIAGTAPSTPASRDRGYATGGLLTGPGHATSDNLIIRVSPGEYVQRAAAVQYYGADFMDRLNRLQLPRFAGGGMVGGGQATGSSGGLAAGDVQAIALALARMSPRATTHQNTFYAYDYSEAMRQAQDAENLTRLGHSG